VRLVPLVRALAIVEPGLMVAVVEVVVLTPKDINIELVITHVQVNIVEQKLAVFLIPAVKLVRVVVGQMLVAVSVAVLLMK